MLHGEVTREMRDEACSQNNFGLWNQEKMRNSDKQRVNNESSKRRERRRMTESDRSSDYKGTENKLERLGNSCGGNMRKRGIGESQK